MRAVAVMVVLAACGSPTPVKIDQGIRIDYSLDLAAVKDRNAAVADAVRVIKRRVDRAHITANAMARGEHVIVDLAPADPEAMERAKDIIARVGKLELRLVTSGAPLMQQLTERVKSDSRGADMIGAETERWAERDGTTHVDYFLTGPDRKALERYLDELRDPTLAIPADHQIAFERVERERKYWRTYYVDRVARYTNQDVANARASIDMSTNRPAVAIYLTDEAAERFRALTEHSVGDKLAIMVDDRVLAAPLIEGPVKNGRLTITSDDADQLAIVLAAGALPTPMRMETVAEIVGDKLKSLDENGNVIMVPR
ncbi:MAG TPA: hypothetical protein VIV40_08070 [Kofleriaceae bacterium]